MFITYVYDRKGAIWKHLLSAQFAEDFLQNRQEIVDFKKVVKN